MGKFFTRNLLSSTQRSTQRTNVFWILVIETKNSAIEVYQGLPQLLAYACKSLEQKPFVWGVITNGLRYMFVYLQKGSPATYQLLPDFNLLELEGSTQLAQFLKALCRLDQIEAIAV